MVELRDTQPVLDKTPNFGGYPFFDSTDTYDDDHPVQWLLKRREVSISEKRKEKVVEVNPKRRAFIRSYSWKLMVDSRKENAFSTLITKRK